MDKVKIAKDVPAVDAYILEKGEAVTAYASAFDIPLEKMATIADGVKDLTFLMTEGLGLVAAPANAQKEVKEAVRSLGDRGHVSELKVYDAFEEFYYLAAQKGITHIVSDRDGVLKDGSYSLWGERFQRLTQEMGKGGKPFVTVLTGSSFGQNIEFMKLYGLDERLNDNPAVQEHPFLLAAENGAIHYNILTGETRNYCDQINPDLLSLLMGEFRRKLMSNIEEQVLLRFNLPWSFDYNDQRGKIYRPPKQSMVTINIPRQFPDGTEGYRKSDEGLTLKEEIFNIMINTAQAVNMPFEVLES